jgi:phosphotransferase system HPr (HPr) family protein
MQAELPDRARSGGGAPATPIRLFRVDPRLVHATLMNAWVPEVQAEVILVVDGAVSRDLRLRTILEMSAMDTPLLFATEEEAAALLRAQGGARTIVLFSRLSSVLRAVEASLPVGRLNVGHVPEGPERKEIHPSVHLGQHDFELIEELERIGVEVFVQPLPTDDPIPPETVSTRAEKASGEGELRKTLRVVNERGLHLRAAHVLAQLASKLDADVSIGSGDNLVNAKSLLGLTTLGASRGTELDVVVKGRGAVEAMSAIEALFASGFDEGVAL